jgi:hypothetical protein
MNNRPDTASWRGLGGQGGHKLQRDRVHGQDQERWEVGHSPQCQWFLQGREAHGHCWTQRCRQGAVGLCEAARNCILLPGYCYTQYILPRYCTSIMGPSQGSADVLWLFSKRTADVLWLFSQRYQIKPFSGNGNGRA